MSGHSTYQPQRPFMRWMERRLPIAGLMYSSFVAYPTPRNLNYWWTFGGILTFMLGVQIITGVVLAMHYTPQVDMAFNSVEAIMRDVNYGWLLRYLHANGAAMFFLAVYIHLFRGMYYGSYKEPREVLWILGVILLLLMIATGFMGYVLPWGQMSFWAATVITNLFSAIPGIGQPIVTWLWGGYAVGNPTLNRFYSLHYLLPFVIAGVVVLHIWALHMVGQNNPTGVEPKRDTDTVPFTPYATIKDSFLMVVFCILFAYFVFYIPNYLGHADNYIPANPAVTPTHIVPEWYYLPFYAILRAIPSKLLGVCALGASISSSPFCPGSTPRRCARRAIVRSTSSSSGCSSPTAIVLGYLGSQPPQGGYVIAARICTFYYFAHFLIVLPLLGMFEKTQSAAEFDHRIRAQGRRAARGLGAAAGQGLKRGELSMKHPRIFLALAVAGLLAGAIQSAAGAGGGRAAAAELVVRRAVRALRSGAVAARLQGLSRGLCDLPFTQAGALPQPRRARRPRFHRGAGRGHRGPVSDRGRPERPGPDVQTSRRTGRCVPGAVPERTGGQGRARSGAAGHVDARQGAHL